MSSFDNFFDNIKNIEDEIGKLKQYTAKTFLADLEQTRLFNTDDKEERSEKLWKIIVFLEEASIIADDLVPRCRPYDAQLAHIAVLQTKAHNRALEWVYRIKNAIELEERKQLAQKMAGSLES